MKQQEDLRKCSHLKCFLTEQVQKIKKSQEVKREMKSPCQGLSFYNTQSIDLTHLFIVKLPDFLFAPVFAYFSATGTMN